MKSASSEPLQTNTPAAVKYRYWCACYLTRPAAVRTRYFANGCCRLIAQSAAPSVAIAYRTGVSRNLDAQDVLVRNESALALRARCHVPCTGVTVIKRANAPIISLPRTKSPVDVFFLQRCRRQSRLTTLSGTAYLVSGTWYLRSTPSGNARVSVLI